MKIAISSRGAGLGAWLHPEFLTSNFIVIVDDEDNFTYIENKTNKNSEKDELELAQEMLEEQIDVLITGQLSKACFDLLQKNHVKIVLVEKGSVLEAVEAFRHDTLKY
jgi:predicted Fe-Mo cluster-binding NifX family protein